MWNKKFSVIYKRVYSEFFIPISACTIIRNRFYFHFLVSFLFNPNKY